MLLTGKLTDITIAVNATGSWYQTVELSSMSFEVRRMGRHITYRKNGNGPPRSGGVVELQFSPDPLVRCITVICVTSVAREADESSVAWMCRLH